jgi:hypothetical protein
VAAHRPADDLRFDLADGSTDRGSSQVIEPDQSATPARLFVLVVGTALVIGGIAGFFYEADFGVGDDLITDNILGTFPTSGWDNLMHLLAGLACLAAASRAPRPMALLLGSGFTVLALWGLLVTDRGFGAIVDVLPVSTEDNLLHLLVGLTGIATGFLSRDGRRRPPAPT